MRETRCRERSRGCGSERDEVVSVGNGRVRTRLVQQASRVGAYMHR